MAEAAGLSAPSETHGENCIADVDDDGLLDVVLSFHEDVWPLMLGRPDGVFERARELDLAARDRHGCAVADFDGDGRLDIYFSIGACRGTCEAPKELWIQQPDGTFADEAERWGISDPGARGRVPLVVEVNGDGRPDLFTGAEEGVDHPSLSRLWINAGDHFELDEGPLTNDIGNLCAAAADLDGDGLDEVAICTPEDGFHLYRNQGGDYVEATAELGLEDYGRRTVEFVDLDGDGDQDLATVARSRVQVYPNEGGVFAAPMFDVTTKDGKDVAFGDLDGDGDVDIYLQEGADSGAPDRVYLNDGKAAVQPRARRTGARGGRRRLGRDASRLEGPRQRCVPRQQRLSGDARAPAAHHLRRDLISTSRSARGQDPLVDLAVGPADLAGHSERGGVDVVVARRGPDSRSTPGCSPVVPCTRRRPRRSPSR